LNALAAVLKGTICKGGAWWLYVSLHLNQNLDIDALGRASMLGANIMRSQGPQAPAAPYDGMQLEYVNRDVLPHSMCFVSTVLNTASG
jgi:hypothetical protein